MGLSLSTLTTTGGTMDNNLEQIVAALRQIQDDGGDSNFVVFTADPLKNYYIAV
jgi:hypothetical protein